MSSYTEKLMGYRQKYESAVELQSKINTLNEKIKDMNKQYVVMLEAQELLAAVSDSNTNSVLDYITGIINKALGEIFPYDERRIYLEKRLHNGQYAHINLRLVNKSGKVRDIQLQTGTGLRQIISFLFVVSLIEVRKGRRILLMDELFSGLHKQAKAIIMDIIEIFADEGFQFVFVEYGANIGKIYMVEKPDETATVHPLNDGDEYSDDDIFRFNPPSEDVLTPVPATQVV